MGEESVNSFCYGPPLDSAQEEQGGGSRELCMEGYMGWGTMADCKEYYKCDNGAPGVIRVCPYDSNGQSLKFDKVRNKCYSAESVNSFCYGPPLDSAQEEQGGGSRELCMEGYMGWATMADCKEYYKCDNGAPGVIR